MGAAVRRFDLLAMVVNDDAYLLSKCVALKTIASKLAPTIE